MKTSTNLFKEWVETPFSKVLFTKTKLVGLRKPQYSVIEFSGDDATTIYMGEDAKEFEKLYIQYQTQE